VNLPRVLIVDDQFARNTTERGLFLAKAGLIEVGARVTKSPAPVAEAEICSGQRQDGCRLINDYEVVLKAVSAGAWALVLLDMQFDSGDLDGANRPGGVAGDEEYGKIISQEINARFPGLPVVFLSGKHQVEIGGANVRYLSKVDLDPYYMRRALVDYGKLSPEQTQAALGLGERVVARDPKSLDTFRRAFSHARSSLSILILGESGVGKEVLARYVHEISKREGPFIALNVAAIPSELFEAELFGIEAGVATAVSMRRGKFESASGGTLFLDEMGDMPLQSQVKVLRALHDHRIVRVGGTTEIAVDIRVICATSKDLNRLKNQGTFREDLLYRINTVTITFPPLRERPNDIEPLARAFLKKYADEQAKSGVLFGEGALSLLTQQPFPGNVRQLEQLVARLVSSAGHHQVVGRREVAGNIDHQNDLVSAQDVTKVVANPVAQRTRQLTLDEALDGFAKIVISKDDPALQGAKLRLDEAVRELLQRLAGAALERYRDPDSRALNRQRAMQLLTGDAQLKQNGPARIINEILGRAQKTTVSDEDLEGLVAQWQARDGHIGNS
jgi:DNA-binding NtrC family response regulator